MICFNPRAREGRDIVCVGLDLRRRSFNPRAREGRDARIQRPGAQKELFQPTRPRGARPDSNATYNISLGFNPRAREGRDCCGWTPRKRQTVSTHAPARGATRDRHISCGGRRVSTHAPARGATCNMGPCEHRHLMFQPTRPRGARLSRRVHDSHSRQGFNPRAREGRDECTKVLANASIEFQPTRPRGARQVREMLEADKAEFQPTRPRGARPHGVGARQRDREVSTHAPARGATTSCDNKGGRLVVSTHAPARGATRMLDSAALYQTCFNPRAREGRDGTSRGAGSA